MPESSSLVAPNKSSLVITNATPKERPQDSC
jgi:hypothetical protein